MRSEVTQQVANRAIYHSKAAHSFGFSVRYQQSAVGHQTSARLRSITQHSFAYDLPPCPVYIIE
jgi:hypothetical protein